ncbi:growth arrest and DNA damage-inducible proteins-interacting protein CRIF [Andrena cerasifolii]|uniref:growth arrest and DNA damage-inducible proteins-interacting protein CRIF n=1 Tax=Andrena cerasifolii TaxID=2819439 RepID=UPI004037E740
MSMRKLLANLSLTLRPQTVIGRCFASKPTLEIVETAQEEPVFVEEDSEEMELKRNKSRLTAGHRNILHGRRPYDKPTDWFHHTVKYKRRTLGKYGIEALGVPAGLAWPTPDEVEDMKEYERVAFPLTLQERWRKIKEKHIEEEKALIARQNEVAAKMDKMEDLIASVEAKVAKKAAEAEEARQKKERRLLEIRHQLGVAGHVTTDKIKEMMAKLEKEDKKKRKEAKKQRMIEREQGLLRTNMSIEADADAAEKGAGESEEGSPAIEEPKK